MLFLRPLLLLSLLLSTLSASPFVSTLVEPSSSTPPQLYLPMDYSERSTKEMEKLLPEIHPAGYFLLAQRTFIEKRTDEAIKWLYVAQIRYRSYLTAFPDLEPSGDPAMFDSLMEVIGRPINMYAGQNIANWIQQIKNAAVWHDQNPYPVFSKTTYHKAYEKNLKGMQSLIDSLEEELKKRKSF